MGSSPSFNPFPGSGRARCGALLPWLWHLSPQPELPREGVREPRCSTPCRAGLASGHCEGGRIVELSGQERRAAGTMLGAPSPAPCPGARNKCWERE